MSMNDFPSNALRQQVQAAIRTLRIKINWKPGKGIQHLNTRIQYEHLIESSTLDDYHTIINAILTNEFADVYVYIWGQAIYPTVVDTVDGKRWLVMFSLNGIMETAFPPTDPTEYLADNRFKFIGKMNEVL